MAKSKSLTPQEIYRQRKQREEMEKLAYLPPGLINHGNTCFMNSVLQGLIATRLLSDLVHFQPISPHIQSLAATPIISRRSPQLTNGHNLAGPYEQPWVNTMPIGDMFLTVVYKAWDSQAKRQREILSPKSILGALGQKYDQYLDFAQQDAHEFLRILLDAMRMEEQDIIKKRQPPPPPSHHKKRRRTTITPSNIASNGRGDGPPTRPASPPPDSLPQPSSSAQLPPPALDDLPLMSFADMLFGGKLTSILVCQKCKHISHTYEDFNDISLSIKPEDYYNPHRKRDRLKNLAKRLTTFPGTGGGSSSGKERERKREREKEKEREKDKTKETQPTPSIPTTTTADDTLPSHHTMLEADSIPKQTPTRLPISSSHALEIQRSSSVPPSPSTERPVGGGHDNPVVVQPRRRSLDLGMVTRRDPSTGESEGNSSEGFVTPDEGVEEDSAVHDVVEGAQRQLSIQHNREVGESEKESEKEETLESDNSHVIVNITGSEDRHVEFVEPKVEMAEDVQEKESGKEKEKKQEEGGWVKIGRRISMTVGLGRVRGSGQSDKEKKKDRERKSRSMGPSGMAIKEEKEETESHPLQLPDPATQKAASFGGIFSSLATTSDVTPQVRPEAGNRVSSEGMIRTAASAAASSASLVAQLHKHLKPLPPRPPLPDAYVTDPTSRTTTPPPLRPPSRSLSAPHVSSPSTAPLPSSTSTTSVPRFPGVSIQRSKSPKPPKPSAAETEYLRKILADVSPSGSNNPFAIFKPPLVHGHHHGLGHSSPSVETSPIGPGGTPSLSSAAWLGIGVGPHLSGIEECLRMFTAVEILDGENMVGCRRCWKIENGMLGKKKGDEEEREDDSDEEREEEDKEAKDPDQGLPPEANVNGTKINGFKGVNVVRPSPLRFSNSMSTPSIPVAVFYEREENTSDSQSISSLPPETIPPSESGLATLKEPGWLSNTGEGTPLSLSAISNPSPLTPIMIGNRMQGPGGLPIPLISTTAPPDTPTQSTYPINNESLQETHRDAAYARLTGNENGVLTPSGSSLPTPNPKLTQALYGYNRSAGSKDSLVIPRIGKPKIQRRKTSDSTIAMSTTSTEDGDSTGDESDTSIGTSVSGDSTTPASSISQSTGSTHVTASHQDSPTSQSVDPPSVATTQTTAQPQPQKNAVPKKPSKPKPVIMRSAYKRYLIATPPPVLVIHLKRFQQTARTPFISFSHGFKKLDDYISFPEYLDLLPFLAPKKEDYGLRKKKSKEKDKSKTKDERCLYRLYAVVVHIGNMLGGHYIAYTALPAESPVPIAPPVVKEPSPDAPNPSLTEGGKELPESASSQTTKPAERQWAYISDTIVRLTTLEEVLNAKAYMCMYERSG